MAYVNYTSFVSNESIDHDEPKVVEIYWLDSDNERINCTDQKKFSLYLKVSGIPEGDTIEVILNQEGTTEEKTKIKGIVGSEGIVTIQN